MARKNKPRNKAKPKSRPAGKRRNAWPWRRIDPERITALQWLGWGALALVLVLLTIAGTAGGEWFYPSAAGGKLLRPVSLLLGGLLWLEALRLPDSVWDDETPLWMSRYVSVPIFIFAVIYVMVRPGMAVALHALVNEPFAGNYVVVAKNYSASDGCYEVELKAYVDGHNGSLCVQARDFDRIQSGGSLHISGTRSWFGMMVNRDNYRVNLPE